MRTSRMIVTGFAACCVLGSGLLFSSAFALAVTPETPVAKPATAITTTTAILHGELNPNKPGEPSEWLFLYTPSSTAECEGTLLPEPFGVALGHEKEAVEVEATSLQPNQTYSFCLGELGEEFVRSSTLMFKTLPADPSLFGGSTKASAVTPFAATLEAQVYPNNQETTYSFEYATNEALTGAETIPGAGPLPAEFGPLTADVSTGGVLASGTTYFFRVIATNATGTTEGPVEHFTTLTPQRPIVASESSSAITPTDATLEAKINPNYQETTYAFEYATNEGLTENVKIVAGVSPLPRYSKNNQPDQSISAGVLNRAGPTTTVPWRLTRLV